MLESKIVNALKINSMRPGFNGLRCSVSPSEAQRRNPILEPNLHEVYIRPINDSLELERDPDDLMGNEGHTLRILPDVEDNAVMRSRSQELKIILSSLVTLSKNQKQPRSITDRSEK